MLKEGRRSGAQTGASREVEEGGVWTEEGVRSYKDVSDESTKRMVGDGVRDVGEGSQEGWSRRYLEEVEGSGPSRQLHPGAVGGSLSSTWDPSTAPTAAPTPDRFPMCHPGVGAVQRRRGCRGGSFAERNNKL